ncbi:MAG: pyridoxamine 5'-phosphate oxidase family protein [Verrucomicrobiae bacterium]|nr:pyridoxamine 5'-phosphate oxidase family protein [Verrucomicrobiae bacterium]
MSREHHARSEDSDAAKRIFGQMRVGKPAVAMLSTVSPEGRPHATWMFASRSKDPGIEILTITSPDSDKVKNVRVNSKVEWLLTSQDRMENLYLEGEAEMVDDVAEIKRLWEMIEGKERAFFMRYYNSGMGFAIIRTRVNSAVYAVPEEYRKVRYAIEELA